MTNTTPSYAEVILEEFHYVKQVLTVFAERARQNVDKLQSIAKANNQRRNAL
ncbi:MAG: hypothetical protein ACK5JS_09230 [Mangrovibacterium sp.]